MAAAPPPETPEQVKRLQGRVAIAATVIFVLFVGYRFLGLHLAIVIPIWIAALVFFGRGLSGGIMAPIQVILGKREELNAEVQMAILGFGFMYYVCAPMAFLCGGSSGDFRFRSAAEQAELRAEMQETRASMERLVRGAGEDTTELDLRINAALESIDELMRDLNDSNAELDATFSELERQLLQMFDDAYASASEAERLETIEEMTGEDLWEYLEFYKIIIRREESEALYARIVSEIQTQTETEIPADHLRMENRHLLLQWLPEN